MLRKFCIIILKSDLNGCRVCLENLEVKIWQILFYWVVRNGICFLSFSLISCRKYEGILNFKWSKFLVTAFFGISCRGEVFFLFLLGVLRVGADNISSRLNRKVSSRKLSWLFSRHCNLLSRVESPFSSNGMSFAMGVLIGMRVRFQGNFLEIRVCVDIVKCIIRMVLYFTYVRINIFFLLYNFFAALFFLFSAIYLQISSESPLSKGSNVDGRAGQMQWGVILK